MDEVPFITRVDEAVFWANRERIKAQIDCTNNTTVCVIRSKDYKNIVKKKCKD